MVQSEGKKNRCCKTSQIPWKAEKARSVFDLCEHSDILSFRFWNRLWWRTI